MIVFFDTETTGIPKNYKAPITDLDNWPRVVQVGWVTYLNNGQLIEEQEHIIKPVKYAIPASVSDIHGITQEIAMRDGEELKKVLIALSWRMFFADTLVGHNIEFDEHVLGAEFLRAEVNTVLHGSSRNKICTMKQSTAYCNIPGTYGPKWPKLTELYAKLFDEELSQTHTALDDIKATARCYFELVRIKVI